jgi:hypothetical protein
MVSVSAQWRVEVVETATGKVVQSIPCTYERKADGIERGLLRNLDRAKFHTRVIEPGSFAGDE